MTPTESETPTKDQGELVVHVMPHAYVTEVYVLIPHEFCLVERLGSLLKAAVAETQNEWLQQRGLGEAH